MKLFISFQSILASPPANNGRYYVNDQI